MKHYPIVEVEWVDSVSEGGWRKPAAYLEHIAPDRCRTVGYLLKSNRTLVTVFQSLSDNTGNVTDSITIPRAAVKSMKRLTEKKK